MCGWGGGDGKKKKSRKLCSLLAQCGRAVYRFLAGIRWLMFSTTMSLPSSVFFSSCRCRCCRLSKVPSFSDWSKESSRGVLYSIRKVWAPHVNNRHQNQTGVGQNIALHASRAARTFYAHRLVLPARFIYFQFLSKLVRS